MAMTEDEKKAARREASRKWYAAHKATNKGVKSVKRRRGRAKVDNAPHDCETYDSETHDDKPLFTVEDSVNEPVVSVDPALLTGIEEGSARVPSVDQDEEYDDDKDDAERLAELEELDPDELTDAEREELDELRSSAEEEDWQTGRYESLCELEEQGAYDD